MTGEEPDDISQVFIEGIILDVCAKHIGFQQSLPTIYLGDISYRGVTETGKVST